MITQSWLSVDDTRVSPATALSHSEGGLHPQQQTYAACLYYLCYFHTTIKELKSTTKHGRCCRLQATLDTVPLVEMLATVI